MVQELLSLKKAPDAALLELENDARDALLEKVSFHLQFTYLMWEIQLSRDCVMKLMVVY